MNYENYKKYFDGGFFPIDSDHKLVNLENTGEYEVTATTGSGADTKVEKHYKPSTIGLTNMLKDYTGGSKFEALTQSQGHTFIPELADCTSVAGAQKAIINHYAQAGKPFVFYIYAEVGQEISFSQEDEENPKMMKIDWGDGTIDEKAEATLSHSYEDSVYEHIVKVWFNGALFFDGGNAAINNIETPVYVSFYYDVEMRCVNKFSEAIGANRLYFNINNSFDQSQTEYLYFGDDNWQEKGFVNINTGLAEWINLEEMKDTLQSVFLHCRNLYWDWKPLEFSQQIALTIAPDPITFKTCVEYFATKATFAGGKPDLYVLPGSQQDELYQWALQYEDKFKSINKE